MKVFNAASYYALYTLTSTIILNIFLGSSVSVNAQQKPIFSCINKRGIWTTVVGTKQGEKNFISWDSTYFITSGYTPKIRCNQVTGRLNLFLKTHPNSTYLMGE
ncbi:MAG: hypothetical protein HC836_29500 [Richelia sp. RM2_1_2]|nr:hypothetical protein [Richelia sp. RM2_1_2]